MEEGLCAQILHVGPYAEEPATFEKLEAFIAKKAMKELLKNTKRFTSAIQENQHLKNEDDFAC